MPSRGAENIRRAEQQQKAYDLQWRGAIEGALRWTVYGAIACAAGHFYWPLFRRQTWALKGFITSSASVTGLIVGADNYLVPYEQDVRRVENSIRRQARNDLARQGKIATEGEIRGWREAREKEDARGDAGST
ncbi:MAG: hypothetical protein TREMPRED_003320 [Tremellales sp. Tagirdzhanova-0007]|nr:MAG: hypothetical protein TREMPRED_003320 [Tremellales sp. Tagirdzhanova-0007]